MINRQLCLFLLIIMGMTPVKKAGWLSVCCRIARAEKFTSPDSTGFGRKNPDELKIHNNPDSTEVLNSPDPDTLQSSPTDSIQHHVSVTADSLPDSTATTGADSLRTPPADTLGILDMLIKKEPVMQRLSADSTLFQGSIYGSFADILDQMPAVFIFQRGSVGQLANGFLFSGIGSNFILDYDGLILNDPLTGIADFNLLPVQSIEQFELVTTSYTRRFGLAPAGQLLQVDSRNIAALPVKSRVTYRAGDNGYDEVDARLGMLASPRLAINAGGTIHNYSGTTLFSKYKAQKINLKIDRKLNANWTARYLLLYNVLNLDEPVQKPGIYYYHHKDYRFDHGLRLQRGRNYTAMLQYTALHREVYGSNRSILNQEHEIDVVRLTTQYFHPIGGIHLNTGVNGDFLNPISDVFPARKQYRMGGWGFLSGRPDRKLYWHGGIRIEKQRNFNMFVQPEFSMTVSPRESLKLQIWATHQNISPALYALYASEPFLRGKNNLKPASLTHLSAGAELKSHFVALYAALSATSAKDRIAPQPQSIGSDTLSFTNLPQHLMISTDLYAKIHLIYGLSAVTKFKYLYFPDADAYRYAINLPDIYLRGYLQYRNLFFQNNLDLSLRFGCTFMNDRSGPEPWYAPVSDSMTDMEPFITPYIHVIFCVKDVVLFIDMQNFTGIEYQQMYGYPMPTSQLRWGVVWRFNN